jgi:hypothetical protein
MGIGEIMNGLRQALAVKTALDIGARGSNRDVILFGTSRHRLDPRRERAVWETHQAFSMTRACDLLTTHLGGSSERGFRHRHQRNSRQRHASDLKERLRAKNSRDPEGAEIRSRKSLTENGLRRMVPTRDIQVSNTLAALRDKQSKRHHRLYGYDGLMETDMHHGMEFAIGDKLNATPYILQGQSTVFSRLSVCSFIIGCMVVFPKFWHEQHDGNHRRCAQHLLDCWIVAGDLSGYRHTTTGAFGTKVGEESNRS